MPSRPGRRVQRLLKQTRLYDIRGGSGLGLQPGGAGSGRVRSGDISYIATDEGCTWPWRSTCSAAK